MYTERKRERERENLRGIHKIMAVGWLRLVGSLKLYVSFAKEPHKKDEIVQKRPIILRSLLIVATPSQFRWCIVAKGAFCACVCVYVCVSVCMCV